MRRWFKKLALQSEKTSEEATDTVAASRSPYRLEALEPRLLLSADPISGEFARVIQEGYDDDNAEDVSAIIQEVSDVAEIHSDAQSGDAEDANFAWPEGWDDADEDDDSVAEDDDESSEDTANESGVSVWTLLEDGVSEDGKTQVDATATHKVSLHSDADDSSSMSAATESDEPASSDADDGTEARAPPVIHAVTSTYDNSSSSSALEGGSLSASQEAENNTFTLSDDQLPTHEAHDDSMPRAPPAANDIEYLDSTGTPPTDPAELGTIMDASAADLDAILELAKELWSISGLIPTGAPALANLSALLVADLPNNALASILGTTITIDISADDFGWYVGTAATPFKGVDLLTVVLHEIGHYLGYSHDAPGLTGLMAQTLAAGERILPGFEGAMTLNQVIDALLVINFDPATPPSNSASFTFTSSNSAVPNSVLVGQTGSFVDAELKDVTLVFSLLTYNASNSQWDGQVSITSPIAVFMPGALDSVIVDDGFETALRIESAGAVTDNLDGTWSVDVVVDGDQRDGEDIIAANGYTIPADLISPFTNGLRAGDEIGVLDSNAGGFNDFDLADDVRKIVVTAVSYSAAADKTTVTLSYNFNPEAGGEWAGGGVIADSDADTDDDGDFDAVGGTIFLGDAAGVDFLRFNTLEATDLGLPIWLDVRISRMEMQFADFRADDTNSTLRLNAELIGFNTGNEITNNLLRSGALGVGFSVEGSVEGLELDMTALRDIRRLASGELVIPSFPVVDVNGITASIGGNLMGLGSIQATLIVKTVKVDSTGAITTLDAPGNREIIYGAISGAINVAEQKQGEVVTREGLSLSLNLAISELGPLQLFISGGNLGPTGDGIPIGTTGLLLDEVRGGIRFNADIEDLQVRAPFGATAGSVAFDAGDTTGKAWEVTLTVPDHNLLVGDEFRITAAGNPNYMSGAENLVVTEVDGDDITYRVAANPGDFATTTDIKKVSISQPEDLRDPGFLSTKDLSLTDWEAQLDQQVVNQANGLTVTDGRLLDGDVVDGHSIIASKVDINDDGVVNDDDDGTLLGFTVIDGAIDVHADGVIDSNDNGVLPPAGFWDVLFDKVVFEAGATVNIAGVPSSLLSFEVDLFLDTTGKLLLTGSANIINPESGFERGNFGVNVPVKIFADLSQEGEASLLFLMDVPEVPANTVGLEPLVVFKGRVTFETLINGVPATTDILTGFPSGVGASVVSAVVTDLSSTGAGPWQITYTLDSSASVADEFSVGDTLIALGSDPSGHDGKYIVTDVDSVANTVTFVVGKSVVNGRIDVDGDGNVVSDADDVGSLAGIPVIEGGLDIDRNGTIDTNDDGEVLNTTTNAAGDLVVVAYRVIDGYVDVDGDGNVAMDADDVVVIGSDPGAWVGGTVVANESDLGNGVRITIAGGVDLNIPATTTLSLDGSATLDISIPGPTVPEDVRLDFDFDMSLSETNVGTIGQANGEFSVTIDTDATVNVLGIDFPTVEVWGAAIITTDFEFLQKYGLYANAAGLLLFNNTGADKDPIDLTNAAGDTVTVVPTANTFAVRLDGSVDFRVDFNENGTFEADEQAFQLAGSFVLSFTAAEGFNVAVFSETTPGTIDPAVLRIGPAADPYLEFEAFGFLAIRSDGIAANIVLGLDAGLPGAFADVASINGRLVFMVNTTSTHVSFTIPASANNRTGSAGSDLVVAIPRAPPTTLAEFSNVSIDDLILGNAWTVPEGTDGAPYVLIHLGGTDSNPNASVNVGPFGLEGKFSFLLSADIEADDSVTVLLEIAANFELDVTIGNTTLYSLEGDGYLRFDNSGLVASLSMERRVGFEIPSTFGFSQSTSFTLELNTTSSSVNYDGRSIDPGFRLSMAGTIIIGGFSVTGLLELEIDAGGATLAIGGNIDLSFVGNLGVSGTLAFFTGPDVNDIGIAGRLVVDLNVGNNTGSTSIFFNGTASYEVNTTLRTQSVPFVNTGVTPATTTISIEPGVLVDIQARAGFNLLGKEVFSIDGRFVFSVSGDGFVIALSGYGSDPTASLTLLDDFITFQTAGALAINDKGFAAYLSLSANLNLPGGFGGVNGNFLLVINTTGEAIPIPGSTTIIPAAGSNDLTALADRFEKGLSITDSTGFVGADASVGPYFFLLYEGKLDVLGIVNFNAEGYITINPDGLIFSLSISGNFLSLVSVDGTISFNSEGEFNLHVEGGFKVGPSGFNIDVHASLDVALLDSNGINLGGDGAYKITASGRVDGTATIFFIPISVGLGISLASNGDVRVTLTAPVPGIAYACTDTFLGEICIPYPTITNKSYSFTIGRITLNPPPPPRLAKQVGSKLTVNAGSSTLRSDRNVSESEINEEIIIGQNGSGDIEVTMFGITQAFSGVTEVIINSDNGNDFVQVAENVSALVRVNLGDGEDVFIGGGVGGVVVNGQNGNDQLTGGIHAQTLNGGAHDDTITGGLGIDNVTGGSGNDIFVWTVGDGQDVVIDGGSNDVNEVDLFRLLGVDGQVLNAVVNAAPTGTGFQLVVGSETLLVTNVESLGVEAGNAADLITVNDLGGSLLDIINIDLGSDGVQDTVTVNGTNSADGFNVDFTNITVDLGGTSSTIASTNIEKVGGVSVGIFGIGSAQDELYINTLGQVDTIGVDSIGPRLQTTIDSGTGSDVITVSSSAGRLNGIDSKLIINGNLPTSGSDYLYIDDSGDSAADVYTLTSGNLSSNDLAPGGIDYSNIEHLIITLGTGADTFTIGSTHSGETIVNANNGNDIVNVRTIAGITTINGEGHVDTVNVGSSAAGTVGDANNNSGGNLAGIGALLTISGGVAAGDTLNVDDTGNSATVVGATLTSVDLVGLSFATGGSIDYGLIENLNINLGAGADTFNVQSTSAITTLRTGAGVNIVNVGSLAPGVGGTVDAIDQRLVIHGESGDDTINVDDTGELDNEIAVLTDSLLTGLGTAANDAEGIEYFGAEFMNINLGTGTDGLTIRSTSALTTVNTGIGSNPNTINVGYQVAASSNSLNAMGGKLVINGQSSGTETLNVSDSGDGDNPQNVGTMTVNRITGLGMAANDAGKGIEYYGFDDLNIDLGTGNDTFTINSTHGGTTDLTAGIGGDVINVRTISGRTSVDSGVGSDTVNVGSNASGSQGDAQNNSGGTLNGIAAFLDVEGDAPDNGSDVLTVDDTADGSSNNGTLTNSTINGLGLLESGAETGIEYTGFEHLVIALGNNGNIFTIDSTHGSAVNGYSGYQNTTSVSTGAGADLITVNDVTDTLTVNGQGGDDDVNVNGTGVGSTGNLNGDGGNDEFHIRNIDGRVYVDGGDNNDNIYVTNVVASLPGAVPQLPDTTQRTTVTAIGSVDDIDALLDVDGGTGIDRMFVDGSDAPILGRAATLTPNTLDGMGLSSEGIDYRGLDFLTIWMDAGSNTLTVNDTHAGTTSVYMSDGSDIVDVNDASGLVNIYGEQAADIFNIRATALNSTLNLRGHEGTDTFNISNLAPTVPQGDYPVGAGPPGTDEYAETPLVAQEIGSVDAIDGLVDIEGGSEADQLNIDDSANLNAKRGTLTSNTLRGMDMPGGVNYRDVEDLNLWLGTNSDILYVDGTHAGTTQIYGGDGITGIADNDYGTPNRDDTIAINTIAGETTIYGQGGNDLILVNVTENTPGGAFVRTHGNGISAANLNLTGNGGSDEYIINLSGLDTAIVNVHDYGSPYDGVDRLVINGADGTATEDDTFLLRKNFVALLNESASSTTGFDQVERVNYDQNINERLVVNGLGGADRFVADDNSSVTTLDGGAGMDSFQIGQIFATLRSADAAAFNQIAPGDEFDTTRVIIGIIRNPDTGEVIFDPSTDQLNAAKILEIESHIDPITGYLAGIAYVSDGVSQPTTVYGGDDDDSFSVYQNKGTLRLEGEANNDSFVVRAFVLLPKVTNTGTGELEELEEQAETEVKGGADDDTIQYAINAPVSIDGGTGFDTVVVLGTPFPDAFVVNSQGIFGAGLNVTFENVESAELDALEGDDQIYVLGTNADLVTLIIGGQGSDTISVMGDVVSDIVSNDLLGRAGLITHRFTAGSGAFANVGVNGVDASVVGADSGSLVDISAAGIRGALAEDSGSTLEYFIQLTNPAAGQATLGSSVYLTVSAGLVSSKDQETDGESVLVSLDGVTWSKSVVLTFDETGTRQSVFVKAIDDPAAEGPRLALISHSINSTDAAYDDLALPDVLIDVVDDDKAGIDIRLFEEIGGVEVVDAITEVLEGVGGFSDIYRIALTRAPNAGETVTVNLSASDRLSYFDKDGVEITSLTFNASTWDTAQLVRVVANDNGDVDGTGFVTITHAITSTGGLYSGILEEAYPTLDVKVFDDESAGAIIRQSDGRTIVVANGVDAYDADDDDSYRVRLTQEITSGVVQLQLFTDQQTELVTDSRLQFVGANNSQGTFEYVLTFNASNWDDWYEVRVVANEQFVADGGQPLKTFTPQDQNLDQIAGPLVIEGGVIEGRDRTFAPALLLPGEQDDSVFQDTNADQSGDIDRLDIFHTDSTAAESGALDAVTNPLDNTDLDQWTLLTGFETDRLGAQLKINEGTEDVPEYVFYDRGISFNGFEIVEVLLGKGHETLDVNATPDDAITIIHGGGGDDTINIFDRGNGPLVVYGDTSEDRVRYSNDSAFASRNGSVFTNDGDDTINAFAMADEDDVYVGLVIYGGFGDDTIDGSQDDDHIAGGTGSDTIRAHGGNDHVYGDSHFNIDPDLFAQDRVTPFADAADEVEDMFIVLDVTPGDDQDILDPQVFIEAAGEDEIEGGAGSDTIFGDHGRIDLVQGTRRIATTDFVQTVTTTLPDIGKVDTVSGDAGGDVIFGGQDGDIIDGGNGDNIVFGDHGEVDYGPDSGDIESLKSITRTDHGGADVITAGSGNDIVIGGRFGDTIRSGGGADIVLGDHGDLIYGPVMPGDSNTLSQIISTQLTDGDIDIIFGEAGDDVIIGGLDDDLLDGGADSDLIFGDAVTLEHRPGDTSSDRFRTLLGEILYSRTEIPTVLQGIPDAPAGNESGEALVDTIAHNYREPGGNQPFWTEFEVIDLHHSATEEAAGWDAAGFGDDYIAGGAGNDMIFGQLGDDVIQGDGSINSAVGATRNLIDEFGLLVAKDLPGQLSELIVQPSVDSADDGDDYIEGNGGSDVIFGNLGQDDIVGGSSNMFSLIRPELRPDAGDILFGGSGTEIDHDELFNDEVNDLDTIIPQADVHARDADVIVGDNANIYRIVGTNSTDAGGFLSFAYDAARGASELIRVRAVALLDYTLGGPDFDPIEAATDIGAADEIHGESGDDFIYGMVGKDLLFGDSESDDIIGGYDADWISGGQGMDGVIGDDGRIYTGRYQVTSQDPNVVGGYSEILNGVLGVDQLNKLIRTPGGIQEAIINPSENGGPLGEIFKTVDITPFNLDPDSLMQDQLFEPVYANDIIFGGLGNDFLHGAAGDDAMSGAEALPKYYDSPYNPGDVLRFNPDRIEFYDYDEEFPRRALDNFVLNFDPAGDPNPAETADDNFDEDVLFGDLGNDWLVGGPDNDRLFGGFGADLMNADDDHGTNGGENDAPDTINIDIQDIAYGGAGRDVLIANTGGDRLMDWVGEFNSFIVPFAPFGNFTVSRAPTPHAFDFLYELSESLGADQSRAVDSGNTTNPERNGEPDGELGLVTQKDNQWQDQTGAPIDPQPGNIPGGPRLTLRGVDFNSNTTETFAVDQGRFEAVQGRLEVSPTNLGETATAVFHVGEYLPHYYEVTATISTGKPTGGLKANSYIIFDYVSPTDFKYAGINISTDKLEIGYVDESGWHELVQVPAKLRHSTDYDVLLSINGLTATLVVDNKDILSYSFEARVDSDGFSYGLNYGYVGLGGISSVARIDNMIVQKLAPEVTFEATETFDAGAPGFTPWNGDWTIAGGDYRGISVLPDAEAVSLFDLNVDPNSYLELEVTVNAETLGGVVFDHYSDGSYKFVGVLSSTNQVVIGHVGKSGNVVYDAIGDITFNTPSNTDFSLRVSLKGSTVSVAVLGGNGPNQTWYEVVGHAFNAVTVDGQAGVLSIGGESNIDTFVIRTDDPAFISDGDELVAPSLSMETNVPVLNVGAVSPILHEAIQRMTETFTLSTDQQTTLASVEVSINDLPGLVLARSNGNQVEVDINAAEHGWFVDSSAADDSEFDATGTALAGSGAEGNIDLLTALMHELGHVLDLEHSDSGIMSESLSTGTRFLSGDAASSDSSVETYAISDQTATKRARLAFLQLNGPDRLTGRSMK